MAVESIVLNVGSMDALPAKDQMHLRALLDAERLRVEMLVGLLRANRLIDESQRTALLSVGMKA